MWDEEAVVGQGYAFESSACDQSSASAMTGGTEAALLAGLSEAVMPTRRVMMLMLIRVK